MHIVLEFIPFTEYNYFGFILQEMIERGTTLLVAGTSTGVPGALDVSWTGMIDSRLLEYR